MHRLNYLLGEEDFRKQRDEFLGLSQTANRKKRLGRLLVFLVSAAFWIYVLQVYVSSEPWSFFDPHKNLMLVGVYVGLIGSLIYLAYWLRSGKYLNFVRQHAGAMGAEILPVGLLLENAKGKKLLLWHELQSVCETEHNLFFQYGTQHALFIPKHAFADEQEKSVFIAEIESHWLAETASRGRKELPRALLTTMDLLPGKIQALSANLLSAVRLAFFLNVELKSFQPSYWQAYVLTGIGLAVVLMGDYGLSQPNPQFTSYGLLGFFGYVLFGILASILISVRAGHKELALPLYVIFSAVGLWINAALYLVLLSGWMTGAEYDWDGADGWAYYGLLTAWWLAVIYRAMRLVYAVPSPLAFHYSSLMYLVAAIVPLYLPQQNFFYSLGPERVSSIPQYSIEDVYYKQGALMDDALRSITDQRPGRTDLYVLAFAGYGDEKVFTNEVDYVKAKFDKLFDANGRSLILGNNPATVQGRPLANAHNLKQALHAYAGKMNPEEDVLFLFLTSHGSKQSGISVKFGEMGMKDIDPGALRTMLDESGIKNRVVVVSACYSGTFIEKLKDPHTLVITASASDKTSFGCGDASEFTYFAEAYFKNALNENQFFIPAFQQAQKEIALREKREGHESSDPQMYVGAKIQDKLAQLELDLSAARH